MQAYAEGKTIQFLNGGKWADVYETDFYQSSDKYRIKPESKYRPFKSQEECWDEMHKHPDFGWVKYKDTGSYVMVSIIYSSTATYPTKVSIDCCEYTFSDAFDNFCFTDGTPFGIKEE